MYEIDFLAVENDQQDGGKSGDAIAIRFSVAGEDRQAVVVIDGGFTSIGEDLVEHIRRYYHTEIVDLVISTHPDADHLNGLATVVEELEVRELLIHRPRLHVDDIAGFSNLDALDELLKAATANRTVITEPFTGLSRFGGQLQILGPERAYYRNLLTEQLRGTASLTASVKSMIKQARNFIVEHLPVEETLTDLGETSERNNSSVITLLQVDSRRLLFTGDAGIPALHAAADQYEEMIGSFASYPLHFFQAPHHGSKHNLGPGILDRILGPKYAAHAAGYTAAISSAKASEKHPSPKVTNALQRRSCTVTATEGYTILYSHGAQARDGWTSVTPIPALNEADDD